MEIYNRIPIGTRIGFIDICLKTIECLADISVKFTDIISIMNKENEYLGNLNNGIDIIVLFKSYISYLDEINLFYREHYMLDILKKADVPSIDIEMTEELEKFKSFGTDYEKIKIAISETFKKINSRFIKKMSAISVNLDEDLSNPECLIKILSIFCRGELDDIEILVDGLRKIIGEEFIK